MITDMRFTLAVIYFVMTVLFLMLVSALDQFWPTIGAVIFGILSAKMFIAWRESREIE